MPAPPPAGRPASKGNGARLPRAEGLPCGRVSMSEITSAPGAQGATPPPLLEPPPVVTLPPVVSSVSAAPAETLVPWVSIWTRPRASLRQVLDGDPRRAVFRLAALGGVAGALKLASTSGFGESHAASIVLSVSLLGGGASGRLARSRRGLRVGFAAPRHPRRALPPASCRSWASMRQRGWSATPSAVASSNRKRGAAD